MDECMLHISSGVLPKRFSGSRMMDGDADQGNEVLLLPEDGTQQEVQWNNENRSRPASK